MTGSGSDAPLELVGSAQAHVVVSSLGDDVVLDNEQAHHLVRVQRLREGESVSATDLAGHWRSYVLAAVRPTVTLEATGPVATAAEGRPTRLVLAAAKASKPDLVVRMATELGVAAIDVAIAERSIVRWDGRRAVQIKERLDLVALAAVKQSRRVTAPQIHVGGALVERATQAAASALVLIADPSGLPAVDLVGHLPAASPVCVVTGPEGGLAPKELLALDEFPRLRLGRHVLRAETAPVAALGALCAFA